jgi:hypothetical protein
MASLSPSLLPRILINSCRKPRAVSVFSFINTFTGLFSDTAAKSFTYDQHRKYHSFIGKSDNYNNGRYPNAAWKQVGCTCILMIKWSDSCTYLHVLLINSNTHLHFNKHVQKLVINVVYLFRLSLSFSRKAAYQLWSHQNCSKHINYA